MSTALYDLGMRLRAARDRRPVPRLRYAPHRQPLHPVAVTVEHGPRGGLTLRAATPERVATGRAGGAKRRGALSALTTLGVSPHTATPPTLVVPDTATVIALARLARTVAPGDPDAGAAATVAWWDQRLDHPGSPSVLVVTDVARARWVLGVAPDAERAVTTWRRWLGVHREEGPAALLTLADMVTSGDPLPGLELTEDADHRSWAYLGERLSTGWDWRRADDRVEAALGLETREDAVELMASLLLGDPLHAQRESFTGNVVSGEVVAFSDRTVTLESDQVLCRLRPGSEVTGWRGGPLDATSEQGRLAGRLADSTVTAHGRLALAVEGARLLGGRRAHGLAVGDTVTLRPVPVDAASQANGRGHLRNRLRTGGNWIARGRAPQPARRQVPFDVLIAAAEEE